MQPAAIVFYSNGENTANIYAKMGWCHEQNENVHQIINAHMAKALLKYGDCFTLNDEGTANALRQNGEGERAANVFCLIVQRPR